MAMGMMYYWIISKPQIGSERLLNWDMPILKLNWDFFMSTEMALRKTWKQQLCGIRELLIREIFMVCRIPD